MPWILICFALSDQKRQYWSPNWSNILLVCENVLREIFKFAGKLKSEAVVSDIEGFRNKKTSFIIEELSIFSNNYSDTILFLPTALVRGNLSSGLVVFQSVYLGTGLGSLPYWFLSQIFISIKLRFPPGKILRKRKREIGTTANPIAIKVCRFEQFFMLQS